MTTLAPGIALALDYLDRAARDEEAGMATGCPVHATCRALVMGAHADIDADDIPMLQLVSALRAALVLAGQVHAQTLTGKVWAAVSEPWEDRESSRDRVRHLCHALASAVTDAAAVGEIMLREEE